MDRVEQGGERGVSGAGGLSQALPPLLLQSNTCSVKENGNICGVRYHVLVIKKPESSLTLIFI